MANFGKNVVKLNNYHLLDMPELPDVENFKNYLVRTSLNKEIVDVKCRTKKLIEKINFEDFRRKLIGKSLKDAQRRGKFLIVRLQSVKTRKEAPSKLIFHFGMTGSLHYTKTGSEKDKSAQLVFEFADGYELRWLCLRKLGKVYLVEDINQIKLLKQMGPEPSQLPKGDFFGLLEEHSRKGVKAFLLDQRDIAGIGNIYSDEILFRAKVNPRRKIKTLTDKQREKLFREMNHVLEKAAGFLAKGQFPKSWLLPSRRVSWKCPRNKGHELKREIIAGRSAIYCPICQK